MTRFKGCTFIPIEYENKDKIKKMLPIEVGIFGGSGNYDPAFVRDLMEVKIYTPYGEPSDNFVLGWMGDKKIAFLARHGKGHRIPPHMINYRANIWGFKALGVNRIISPTACGSLQEHIDVGEFVISDQLFDRTFGQRKDTFYEGGVIAHVSFAQPFCPELRKVIIEQAKKLKLKHHAKGTYVAINGPRFSTAAESVFYRKMEFTHIGMTAYPEAYLAREAEICFANISMVTDKDIYGLEPVSSDEVMKTMSQNVDSVRKLLAAVIPTIPKAPHCHCQKALDTALL